MKVKEVFLNITDIKANKELEFGRDPSQIPLLWCWQILTSPTSWLVEPASKSSSRGTKGCFLLRHFKRLHWGPILSNGLAQIVTINYFWGLVLSNGFAQIVIDNYFGVPSCQLVIHNYQFRWVALSQDAWLVLRKKDYYRSQPVYDEGTRGNWNLISSGFKILQKAWITLDTTSAPQRSGFPQQKVWNVMFIIFFGSLQSVTSLLKYLDQSTVHPPPTKRIMRCYMRR